MPVWVRVATRSEALPSAATTSSRATAQKLSGPLLDRIDLRLLVPRLTKHELLGATAGRAVVRVVRARVVEARERQLDRYEALGHHVQRASAGGLARRHVALTAGAERFLGDAVDKTALSGRGFDRVLKVARTIADLDRRRRTDAEHVGEALSYREAFDQVGTAKRAS